MHTLRRYQVSKSSDLSAEEEDEEIERTRASKMTRSQDESPSLIT
jgi:hypothetical protein